MATKLYQDVMDVETQLFLGKLKLELIGASLITRDPLLISQLLEKPMLLIGSLTMNTGKSHEL